MQAANNPVVGAPTSDQECWYTVLTNSGHVTADKTLHYQAVKGNRLREAINKAWSHELSGRLISLAGDAAAILHDARNRLANVHQGYIDRGQTIPSKIILTGVACATASEIRATPPNVPRIDVVYTPIMPSDPAHSDIVTYQAATKDDLDLVRDWLIRTLRVIQGESFESLVDSCGQ